MIKRREDEEEDVSSHYRGEGYKLREDEEEDVNSYYRGKDKNKNKARKKM